MSPAHRLTELRRSAPRTQGAMSACGGTAAGATTRPASGPRATAESRPARAVRTVRRSAAYYVGEGQA